MNGGHDESLSCVRCHAGEACVGRMCVSGVRWVVVDVTSVGYRKFAWRKVAALLPSSAQYCGVSNLWRILF